MFHLENKWGPDLAHKTTLFPTLEVKYLPRKSYSSIMNSGSELILADLILSDLI